MLKKRQQQAKQSNKKKAVLLLRSKIPVGSCGKKGYGVNFRTELVQHAASHVLSDLGSVQIARLPICRAMTAACVAVLFSSAEHAYQGRSQLRVQVWPTSSLLLRQQTFDKAPTLWRITILGYRTLIKDLGLPNSSTHPAKFIFRREMISPTLKLEPMFRHRATLRKMCSLSGTTTNHLIWPIVFRQVRQKIPQIPTTTLSSPVWWDQVHQE